MMRTSSNIKGGSVEPISAGIGAAGSLVGGLMSAAAEKERQKKQAMQEALMAQGKSQQEMGQGQQGAFQSMMDSYKSALIR
jgi:hypothetical protein